jgi:Cu+-exporting ATPase
MPSDLMGREEPVARDVVCGKLVAPEQAVVAYYRDLVYHFCSMKCKLQFEGEPEAYIDADQRKGEKPLPTQSMLDGPIPPSPAGP